MDPQTQTLSRDEVVESERRAWADTDPEKAASTSTTASTSGAGAGAATRSRPRRGGRRGRAGAIVRTATAKGAHHDHTDHRHTQPMGTDLPGQPRALVPERARLLATASATRSSRSTTHRSSAPCMPVSPAAGGGAARRAPSGKSRASSAARCSRPATRRASTAATGAGWRPSRGASAPHCARRAAC